VPPSLLNHNEGITRIAFTTSRITVVRGWEIPVAEQWVQQRLAAILAADVVGYSRPMEQDVTGILSRLRTGHGPENMADVKHMP